MGGGGIYHFDTKIVALSRRISKQESIYISGWLRSVWEINISIRVIGQLLVHFNV